jgi:hypothetical protein
MARRFPTFVVLLPLLAACSTTAPVDVKTFDDDHAVYFEGVSTRYALSVDELRTSSPLADSRLPRAVVAGDASITTAASLFRCGDVFTLDIILHNHGEAPVVIDRSKIELFDANGARLTPLLDWSPGTEFGLRADQSTVRTYAHLQSDAQHNRSEVAATTTKRATTTPTAASSDDTGSAWIGDMALVRETVTLPATLDVSPGRHRPYWAYWRAEGPLSKLTAVITVDDKRMMLEFAAPGRSAR